MPCISAQGEPASRPGRGFLWATLNPLQPAPHQEEDGEQHRHDDEHEQESQHHERHGRLFSPFLSPWRGATACATIGRSARSEITGDSLRRGDSVRTGRKRCCADLTNPLGTAHRLLGPDVERVYLTLSFNLAPVAAGTRPRVLHAHPGWSSMGPWTAKNTAQPPRSHPTSTHEPPAKTQEHPGGPRRGRRRRFSGCLAAPCRGTSAAASSRLVRKARA